MGIPEVFDTLLNLDLIAIFNTHWALEMMMKVSFKYSYGDGFDPYPTHSNPYYPIKQKKNEVGYGIKVVRKSFRSSNQVLK